MCVACNISEPVSPSKGLLKDRGPIPSKNLIHRPGWGLRSAFSMKFPVILMLLIQGPHFESH